MSVLLLVVVISLLVLHALCEVVPKGSNAEGKPHEVTLKECSDRYKQCPEFAANGECDKNPG